METARCTLHFLFCLVFLMKYQKVYQTVHKNDYDYEWTTMTASGAIETTIVSTTLYTREEFKKEVQ